MVTNKPKTGKTKPGGREFDIWKFNDLEISSLYASSIFKHLQYSHLTTRIWIKNGAHFENLSLKWLKTSLGTAKGDIRTGLMTMVKKSASWSMQNGKPTSLMSKIKGRDTRWDIKTSKDNAKQNSERWQQKKKPSNSRGVLTRFISDVSLQERRNFEAHEINSIPSISGHQHHPDWPTRYPSMLKRALLESSEPRFQCSGRLLEEDTHASNSTLEWTHHDPMKSIRLWKSLVPDCGSPLAQETSHWNF